jgi:predicted dehydrogenase
VKGDAPLRLAIVGCGWAGQRHAAACKAAGAVVAWAVDTDRGRAEALAGAHAGAHAGARTGTEYQRALDDPNVEAVDICLPHHLHADAAVAAARAGKHVLVEKPIAATLDEADRMIGAAGAAGVRLMVAESVRFHPHYLAVRDLVRSGAIGRPALLQMTRQAYLRESFLRDRPWFLDAKAAVGGIMMSGGVHDFETMRMVVGEVESIHALRAPQRFVEMEGDDTSVALVRFRGGAVGTLVESFLMKSLDTAAGPEVHTLRIDGELGSIAAREGTAIRVFSERPSGEHTVNDAAPLVQHELHVPAADVFEREIAHFVECVRTGREPETSGLDQRRPLEIVLAAYRSMESGHPVTLAAPPARA